MPLKDITQNIEDERLTGNVVIPSVNIEALKGAIKLANDVRPVRILFEEVNAEKATFTIMFHSIMSAFYVGRLYEHILQDSEKLKTHG